MKSSSRVSPDTQRPLRIALIGSSRFGVTEPFCGGLEAHTMSTVRALQRAGHDVTLFAGPGDQPAPPEVELHPIVATSPDFGGVERSDTEMTRRSEADMDDGYRRTIEMVDDPARFDVVHNNSLHPVPVMADAGLSLPMVHVLHCPPFPELAAAHRLRCRSAPHGTLGEVIAVSDTLRAAWSGVATSTVTNGVPVSSWTPLRGRDVRRRCVWAGRIVDEKGPHLAIDAARAAGLEIVIAGPIQHQRYFDEFVRPRLGDDARHVGHLGRSALTELFATSAVGLVTPRWEEPFGLVAAEMLSCGLPVAAFARGALPSIVHPSVGGLAEADDVIGLAAAIGRCLGVDRARCRQHAVSRLSDDRMAAQYVSAYESAIERSTPGSTPGHPLNVVA